MDHNDVNPVRAPKVSRRVMMKAAGAAGASLAATLALGRLLPGSATLAERSAATAHSALARPSADRRGSWGVSAFGGGNSETVDIRDWQGLTGRPVEAVRVYIKPGPPPVYSSVTDFPEGLSAALTLGLVAVLSYRPEYSGTRGPNNLPSREQMQSDQDLMVRSLNSIIDLGFPRQKLRVSIWHEARSHGVSAAQYLNLYSGLPSGGVTNYAALHAICPVYHIDLGNLKPGAAAISQYFPGPPTLSTNHMDGVCVDWYGGNYVSGDYVQSWESLADNAVPPVGLGLTEFANSAGVTFPHLWQMANFLLASPITVYGKTYQGDPINSIEAVFSKRLGADKTNLEMIWYQNDSNTSGANAIIGRFDPRIPMLQRLHDSLFDWVMVP